MPEDPPIHITVQTPPIQDEPPIVVQVSSPRGPVGPAGPGAQVIDITEEDYYDLTPEEQLDETKIYAIIDPL